MWLKNGQQLKRKVPRWLSNERAVWRALETARVNNSNKVGITKMITDKDAWDNFERELLEKSPADFHKNLMIYEAMYREALTLGVFPLSDPLEGIEVDIEIAKVINSV